MMRQMPGGGHRQEPGEAPARPDAPASPVFFGPDHRALFGWYHPGAFPRTRRTGVVIIPPVGYEYVSAHRTIRALAERLATDGFPVLRFDHEGTGDSFDARSEQGRVRLWIEGIRDAIAELRSRSGCQAVSLVGFRLGGTLALAAAAEFGEVEDLVLWCSCATGRSYVRETKMLAIALATDASDAGQARSTTEGCIDAAGFSLAPVTAEALGGLDLGAIVRAPAKRVLVIERDDLRQDEAIVDRLRALGVEPARRKLPGYTAMMTMPLRSVVPASMLDAIAGWFDQGDAGMPATDAVRSARAAASASNNSSACFNVDGRIVLEKAAYIGKTSGLFGIISTPHDEAAVSAQLARPAIVLLNAAADHHAGPHRLHVPLAREWAALGFTVLRFDLRGIGDSGPVPPGDESRAYPATAMADVRSALGWLQEESGVERCVLVGVCSGAYHALLAAREGMAVAAAIAVNPPLYFQPGDKVDVDRSWRDFEIRRVRRALLAPRTWRKLARGQVDLSYNARLLASFVTNRVGRSVFRVVGARRATATPALFRAGQTYLIFSRGDPGLHFAQTHVAAEIARLTASGALRLEVVDGADHTFMAHRWQHELRTLLTAYLLEQFG